jgi:hypothetical protein
LNKTIFPKPETFNLKPAGCLMTPEQKFQSDPIYRLHRIRHFAKKYAWKEVSSPWKDTFVFAQGKTLLTVNTRTLELTTTLFHPKWGQTALMRSGSITEDIVQSIFRNPRQHTGKKVNSQYL